MAIHERTNIDLIETGSSPIPRDEFSVTLKALLNNPTAVVRSSTIDLTDAYGNLVTWNVKTIRADGLGETVFIQTNTAEGGRRIVLPPEVVAALVRQRGGAVAVARSRSASRAAATREARGIAPGFLGKSRKGKRGAK